MGWIFSLLGGIVPLILQILKGLGPPPIAVEAEKAGTAQAELKDETNAVEQVQKSSDAASAASTAISSDAGLRKYEQSDPNNRDTHS